MIVSFSIHSSNKDVFFDLESLQHFCRCYGCVHGARARDTWRVHVRPHHILYSVACRAWLRVEHRVTTVTLLVLYIDGVASVFFEKHRRVGSLVHIWWPLFSCSRPHAACPQYFLCIRRYVVLACAVFVDDVCACCVVLCCSMCVCMYVCRFVC